MTAICVRVKYNSHASSNLIMLGATRWSLWGWENKFLAHLCPVYKNTKIFLRLLHPNKLYKLSVKNKFDLVSRGARQETVGSNWKSLTENTEWLKSTNSTKRDTRATWTHRDNKVVISLWTLMCMHTLKSQSDSFREQEQNSVLSVQSEGGLAMLKWW